MKKVLILSNYMDGLVLFRAELINKLVNVGYSVTLSVPLDDREHPFNDCDIINTPVNRRGMNPIQDLKLSLRYISILRKTRPDVVLTYTIKPNLYGGMACRLLRIPYMPNVTGLGGGVNKRGFARILIRLLTKSVFRRAYVVFIQNYYNYQYLQDIKALSDNGLRIPGSGVSLEKWKLLDYPPPEAPVTFNFVARIMKEKGIDEYLEAVRRVKDKYPETIFNVIGFTEEPIYDNILQAAQKESVICFHGYKADMLPWVQSCHCTVNPSYHEGMSNVLQESSACGRPVIASDISGCREIVEDGVTGYLCEVKSAESLADKMEKFILLPYDEKVRMGLRARDKMRREFDRDVVVSAYMKEIEKVLERRP